MILATLENGWFAAWWPGSDNNQRPMKQGLAPLPLPPIVVRGYDDAGVLMKEITPDR